MCVARIGAAHGVRGEVKLWPFTDDPLAVMRYGALETKDRSRSFTMLRAREAKDFLVATFEGVTTRNDAERLTGIELYVSRAQLPDVDHDEFYHADLIGLRAETADGTALGRVIAVHNFGAGDILEIAPPRGPTLLMPFTDAVVPSVDVHGGVLTVVPPQEIEGDTPDAARTER